ncbi:MAG: hypothetical protein KDC87_18125 [Planctomycetes bacterium]|nr:hypothetical protein [Planctomycetota bacterium]MCB9889287.1 hypothetical protein [Planctomycetota bacterium]
MTRDPECRGADRAAPALTIRLRRVSPTHHRFEWQLPGDAPQSRELETKSCLLHDLVHFALESEAELADGLFGSLARGVRYETLTEPDVAAPLWEIERVVGPLQSAWRRGFDPVPLAAAIRNHSSAMDDTGRPAPHWLHAELLTRVAERLRQLEGHWRATRFGAAMELSFPVPA